jgi:ATP-binding cassette subfamily C protein LapB
MSDGTADMVGQLEAAAQQMAAAVSHSRDDGPQDILAQALCDVAAHYGSRTVAKVLVAGLPLVEGRLPLEHVASAARRANLSADVATVPLSTLKAHDLPVLVMTSGGSCVVLWEFEAGTSDQGATARLSRPGQSEARIALPLNAIEQAPSRQIVRLRPEAGRDERGETAVRRSGNNWFLSAFRDSGKIYGEAIAATVALNLLALALPLFTMNVYDRVLPNAVETTLWALAIGVVLATLFDFLIKTLRAEFVDVASRRADVVLANLIFGRLLGARANVRPVSAGVRANALREFETLREFFNSATLTAFGDVPFLIFFLAMIFVVGGPLGWIALLTIPVVLGIGWVTQKRLTRLSEKSFRDSAQKNAIIVETIVGLDSVKAAGAESWAAGKWEAAVSDQIRAAHASRYISNLGIHTIFAIQTLTQIAMVVAGFYLVAAGSLTMGGLIAATMLAGRALQPLGQIAMLITRLHQTRLAFRALSEIVDLEQECPEGARLLAKAEFSGRLAVEGLGFFYDKDEPPCLSDVTFTIAPGEHVGLIGAIGSGKTTLLKLMHAVYVPNKGRVTADGVPVHQIDPSLLRANIGLALQGADLFHGTIRTNIALADPGAPDEDVIAAARAAGALEWILKLPKGFETLVRERGAGLSGGQRQSVALARALFRSPRIVLLDEPTSDMDLLTEQHVVRSMKAALKDCTIVAISHRPAVLALVDRLIVMEGGRVILDGKKADVLRELEARRTAAQTPKVTISAAGAVRLPSGGVA